jgi:hypothetical protein
MVVRCFTRVSYITFCVLLMTTFALDYKGGLNYIINTPFTFFSDYKRERCVMWIAKGYLPVYVTDT